MEPQDGTEGTEASHDQPDPTSSVAEAPEADALARELWTLDQIPSGCLLLAADWTITHVNPAAERLLGRRRADLVGLDLRTMSPGAEGGVFDGILRRAMAEQTAVAAEGYYPLLESWFTVQAMPWRSGLALFVRDVARERRIAARVLESEAQLRDFLESATDFIHMIAPDGRVLYANRAWRDALGYDAHEVAQLSIFDVVAPESREAARMALHRTLVSRVPVQIQMTVVAKDGRRIVVRGWANRRVTEGVGVNTRGIYRDVTAELEAAEAQRKAWRAEASAMRAKSAFLDRVSHELRTPLTAIIGFADLLRVNRDSRLAPAEVHLAERIAARGRDLLSLVEDVLAYADIEANRRQLEREEVDIAALLRDVIGTERMQLRYAGIPVHLHAPAVAMLETDAPTLRRIVRYVLDDAIKQGAESSVTVRLATDSASGAARTIEIRDEAGREREAAYPIDEDPCRTLELGLTAARSLCHLVGHRLVVEHDDLGATIRKIELSRWPGSDPGVQDEMATTLHAFLDASPLPIIAFAPDWTVRIWNDAAARLFGWSSADVVGKRLPVLREEDESTFRDRLRHALESVEGAVSVPARHVRRDGSTVEVVVSLAPLRTPDDRLRGFISIVTDVSERNRLETELRQAQKMEVVGRLAGGIAHDFNNLLTVISAHTQVLLQHTPEHDDLREEVTGIWEVTARGAELARQLLLFARKEVPERRVVDLNQHLRNAERMLRRTLGNRIALVAAPSATPVYVHADPAQIERVILNLALNARDAMPSGGTLTLRTAVMGADSNEAGSALLEVADTGIGMDDLTRDRAFEPFFTTKGPGEGTGLGLATVYRIVRDSGGTIRLETAPGKGTTFRIYLPLVTGVD